MTIKVNIYLDLDGVMADFDSHFPTLFGSDHKNMPDEDMWLIINNRPDFFRSMPVCEGAIDFFKSIHCFNPIILTACLKTNYAHVARQKREWVREHLSTDTMVLPVLGGHNKPLFMHKEGDILIDDWSKNIKAWEKAGGVGILHRNFYYTSNDLKTLLSNINYQIDISNTEKSLELGK